MPPVTLQSILFKLNETWVSEGLPAELWSSAGPFAKALEMMAYKDWGGDFLAKLPLYTGLTGMAGSNYGEAYTNSTASRGAQYQYPQRLHKVVTLLDEQFLANTVDPSSNRSRMTGKAKEMALSLVGAMRVLSYLIWSDGTGRIAKGDGVYSVAGTTITLKNAGDAQKFEIDDRLVFVDPAAGIPAGGQPTPRVFAAAPNDFLRVTAVNRQTGVLTVDKAVSTAIPTATNADYLGKTVFFDAKYGIVDGLWRVIARKESDASNTVFNVDRSTDPTRLSGSRVLIDAGESPYAVIGKMLRTAMIQMGSAPSDGDWTLWINPGIAEDLISEMKANGVQYRSTTTATDRVTLKMGYNTTVVSWPDFADIKVTSDHFKTISELSQDEDREYVLVNAKNVRIKMTADAFGFKAFEDSGGFLKQIPGEQDYYAQGGFWGNLCVDNPVQFITASPYVGN